MFLGRKTVDRFCAYLLCKEREKKKKLNHVFSLHEKNCSLHESFLVQKERAQEFTPSIENCLVALMIVRVCVMRVCASVCIF